MNAGVKPDLFKDAQEKVAEWVDKSESQAHHTPMEQNCSRDIDDVAVVAVIVVIVVVASVGICAIARWVGRARGACRATTQWYTLNSSCLFHVQRPVVLIAGE